MEEWEKMPVRVQGGLLNYKVGSKMGFCELRNPSDRISKGVESIIASEANSHFLSTPLNVTISLGVYR